MKSATRATAELVVRHLRSLIERGDLRPGDRLPPERLLALQLGVSRPTVRAGIRPLAAVGILTVKHGTGTFITGDLSAFAARPLDVLAACRGITRDAMLEAVRLLDVNVASLAAERATDEQIATMADEITGLYASLDDAQAFQGYATRFRQALARASANPILAAFVDIVSALCASDRRDASRASALREEAEAQRSVYQAVRAHDPGRARAAMHGSAPEAGRQDFVLHERAPQGAS